MKKRIILISAAVITVLLCVFSFAGCTSEADGDTVTPIAQLQTDVTTLKSDVAGLGVAVASISVPSNLSSTLSGLQTSSNSLTTSVTTLQSSVSTLQAQVTILNNKVAELEGGGDIDLTALSAEIDALSIQLDDMYAALLYFSDANIVNRLLELEAEESVYPMVEISKFISGSGYLEFTTNTTGDYVVVLTLYGTALDLMTPSAPPSHNVEIISSVCYGGNTMRVLILQPKPTTSPVTYPNWTIETIEVVFTNISGGFSADYASITTGER